MNEKPILFSAEMVRKILEDKKTQTRRVMKPQPEFYDDHWHWAGAGWNRNDVALVLPGHSMANRCPYGQPGDRLWVKETFGIHEAIACGPDYFPNFKDKDGVYHPVTHFAGKENNAWGLYGPPRKLSGLFMPRSAARIILEVVEVRVERLWKISDADVKAEGISIPHGSVHTHYDHFLMLWDSINASRGYGWDTNPWVWVIEFKRIKRRSIRLAWK